MTDPHTYCAGFKDGRCLKKELKKTSVKILEMRDFASENGWHRDMTNMICDWQTHVCKILDLERALECQLDEAACKRHVQRLFNMLDQLRKEMDICEAASNMP